VASPLLANLYLHWFDKQFHKVGSPGQWANAVLVRYADDFVVLARYQGRRLQMWIEQALEKWLGLTLNRGKTSIVNVSVSGATLDFLGYSFRYDRDLRGRQHRYLNQTASKESLNRARAKLRSMTDKRSCHRRLPELIEDLNRHLVGWSGYFGQGYPRQAFREVDRYVRYRLVRHLRRRSQRSYRPPQGRSFYKHFAQVGLIMFVKPRPLAV
jgi:RNA-directed DNA polymerase